MLSPHVVQTVSAVRRCPAVGAASQLAPGPCSLGRAAHTCTPASLAKLLAYRSTHNCVVTIFSICLPPLQVQLESKPEAIDVLERQLIRLQVSARSVRGAAC